MKANTRFRELRRFGLTLALVLAVLSVIFYLKQKSFYPYFSALSLLFLVTALAKPLILEPVERLLMKVTSAIGSILTAIILSVLYFAVITPIGILLKMSGKDLLNLRKVDAASYWIKKEEGDLSKERYEKQF